MIEKGKYYLCVKKNYVKENVVDANPTNGFLYHVFDHPSDNTRMTRYIETERKEQPMFFVGNIYHSPFTDYLVDEMNAVVEINGENINSFVDINFSLSQDALEKIRTLEEKSFNVHITPLTRLKQKNLNSDIPITIDDVDVSFFATINVTSSSVYGFWAYAHGRSITQIGAINEAWKSLRLKSTLIKKLFKCLRGAYPTYKKYHDFFS